MAKSKVKHGEWLDWLAENCPEITRMTANNYMRLYQRAESNVNLILHLTPMQAYKELGIVRDANDTVKDFEPLPPPEGTYYTIIGEATIRLKWHKGRILGEMEKAQGKRTDLVAECNQVGTPTYSELGIDKTSAAREQLVKRAFNEERILDI